MWPKNLSKCFVSSDVELFLLPLIVILPKKKNEQNKDIPNKLTLCLDMSLGSSCNFG